MSRILLGVIGLAFLSSNAFAGPAITKTLTPSWVYNSGGYVTNGLAFQGVSLVVMEGAVDPTAGSSSGRATFLYTGKPYMRYYGAPNTTFAGFPLVAPLQPGNPSLDVVLGETGDSSAITAVNSAGAPMWSQGGYNYVGNYGQGPSLGDVRSSHSGNELVAFDFDGKVTELDPATGAILATGQAPEHLSGHATLANVTGTAAKEIVFFGSDDGSVIVMGDDGSATLKTLYISDPLPMGFANESGPAVADLNKDGMPEIVVAPTQGGGAVYAFSMAHGTGCEFAWSTGDADYFDSSPSIGEVIAGNPGLEVVTESSDAVVHVLGAPARVPGQCAEGTVLRDHTVGSGGGSWFTPVVANMTGDASRDIVAASYDTIEVIDGATGVVKYTYTDYSAAFTPTAVYSVHNLFVSGWSNGKVYRFLLPSTEPVGTAWTQYGGNTAHTGYNP